MKTRSSLKYLKNIHLEKLSVKEFGYSKVAGLYQSFPKKLAGSQVFLKHIYVRVIKPFFQKPLSGWFRCFAYLLFCFFFNFVNRAGRIWLSDTSCDVMLKRNEMLWSLTWKMLARKNIKKQKRLVFHLKALFSLKNIIWPYFSPIAKLW